MRPGTEGCGCFPTGRHYPGIAHLLRARVAGLATEFEDNANWVDLPIVMLDTETTGRDASQDRIVEIGIVVGRRGEIVSRVEWLINPGRPIPEDATKVHGIKDEDVKDKPRFADACREVMKALEGAIPAAYNAAFDRGFVMAELRRARLDKEAQAPALREGVQWIDPLVWARHLHSSMRSRTLGEMASRLGVELDHAHRATADAEAALLIMYKLAEDPRVPKTYGALIMEQVRLARGQEEARSMWRNR